jgi:hypothetical protein
MHPGNDKPKHKPNPKHTLEEILKSLQDLIRNDLLEGDTTPETGAPAKGATSTSATAPSGGLEELRHTLENLVTEELTAEDAPAVEPLADAQAASEPTAAPPTEVAIPPEGLQETLSLDAAAQALSPDETAASTPASDDELSFETIDLAAPPMVTTPETTESGPSGAPEDADTFSAHPVPDRPVTGHADATLAFETTESPTADLTSPTPEPGAPLPGEAIDEPAVDGQPAEAARMHEPEQPDTRVPETAGDWDDIPVLEEVVAEMAAEYEHGELANETSSARSPRLHPEVEASRETAAETPLPDNLALPLPAPSRAHDLAVRTVAKLNIELRKAGKRPLDAKVIARLAMMLRETLESDAAKVENKPHE